LAGTAKSGSTDSFNFIVMEQATNYTAVNEPATVVWTFYNQQPSTLGANAVFQAVYTYIGGFLEITAEVNTPTMEQTGGDIGESLENFVACPGKECTDRQLEAKAGLTQDCPADTPEVTLYAPQLLNPPIGRFCFDRKVHIFKVELKLNSTKFKAEEVASFGQ
jgi:hypothetical protein